ncbi:MBL fold metallo-hydrolase [Sporosarcina obsidiansis]|uniref:MBL fold metallo-hydrolase n=1 Tax=Sporosarcina obsidiansis TaxID=2660748 RepID=UPI00129B190B|nr:MBL fold metallo-hydrolase [Sporosarcina obsidiansis]
MKVTMLGTGAALPDPDRGHTSILITVNEKQYLFDCGNGATRQLIRANVDPSTVDVVFLTHLHMDHIADLPFFLLSGWICDRKVKPSIIGPPGTKEFVDHSLENGAFAVDINARAQFPQRRDSMEMIRPDISIVTPGLVYEDENIKVYADYVEHIESEFMHCFGFRVEAGDKVVTFSGDTAPSEALLRLAQDADVLIHECSFPEEALEFRKKVGIGTFAHTSPIELGKIATQANVKTLIPTHFAHFDTTSPIVKKYLAKHMPIEAVGPEMLDSVANDIRENFKGSLQLGRDLLRVDV